jgi:ribosomal protein L14
MKNLLTLTVLLLIEVILLPQKAKATNYYFSSSNGDDSRTSTQAQSASTPWKSIDKLNTFFASLKPGDSVLFNRGDVFYGKIIVNTSGTSGSPIVLGAYGTGARPIITGFTTPTSWTSIGNGVYETVVTSGQATMNMVARDDAFQPIGRWPKLTDANSGYLTYQSHSGTTSITSNAITSASNYVGGEVVIRANHFNIDRGTISAQTSTTITYTMLPGGGINTPSDNFGFFFQNHVNTLTTLGEWCYEASTKKLKMYFGSNTPSSYTIKASVIDNNVAISSKSYITFDNLSFTGSNEKAFNLTTASNIQINNCDISFAGINGVSANSSSSNITVFNSNFSFINNNGIDANYATYWTIRSNTFNNIGTIAGMGVSGDGQYLGTAYIGDNSLMEYNTLTNSGYHGFHFAGSSITIQNNFISNFCMIKDDGGGIYSYKNTATGVKTIKNNIVLNGLGQPNGTDGMLGGGAVGIYLDGASYNVQVLNNSVANCEQTGILFNDGQNATVSSNTIYNCGTPYNNQDGGGGQLQLTHWSGGQGVRNVSMMSNIFLSKLAIGQGTGRFVSPDNDISQFFSSSDNNYYARPIDDNSTVLNRVSSPIWLTLAQWQSVTGKDVNSKKSPKTITNVNDLRFEYNASASNKVVNLGATYMDVTGKNYPGTITLAPYTSAALIYVSGVVSNSAPIANAGKDQTLTLPTNTATLTGSGTDSNGTISSYQWAKIAGPSQYAISSQATAQTTISNLAQGVYQFQLIVTDSSGATGKDTVNITVNPAPNQAPIANAGSDINITLPTNTATLSGSGSDANGTVASYQWTKIYGPTQYTIASPTQPQTAVNNLVQGIYKFQLIVTDNSGATGKDTVIVTVNAAPNQPPIANAGLDVNITLPVNTVTLSGSGSDADGTIASYQWTKIAGPSQFTIASPAQAQTSVNNLMQGIYKFQLLVTDNSGATAKDTVAVSVNAAPNQPPIANAGTDMNITLPVNTVTLSGSGSDADGTVASYQWTKISGPSQFTIASPTQAQTPVNNLVQGIYKFQLLVTDNSGATAKDSVAVSVNAALNQPPIANAGADMNITLPVNTVTLSGSGSDADGTIASYQWTKISGPSQYTITSPTQAQTSVNNLVQGVYKFQLSVTDNSGATGKDTVTITVNAAVALTAPPNQSPTANAGIDINITLPVNTVILLGSGSDPDGTIASYQWTKISGPSQYTIASPAQAQTTINNLVQGIYKFQLLVTDNSGATAMDTVAVVVNAAPNQPPVANAGANITIMLPTNTATLSGSGTDADGTIVSYQWTKISGPSQYTLGTPTKAKTTVGNLLQGIYTFELKVTDNSGASAADTVQVTVNAAAQIINQSPVANAGADIVITLPTNTVTLNGTGTDPDGKIASYLWTKIAGPSQYTIASATKARTSVKSLLQGVYTFVLKVTDNLGATGTDTINVTVNASLAQTVNKAPIANAGADINITLPVNTVTLSGSGSDSDGTIVSYQWTKISGPSQDTIVSVNQSQTTVNGLVEGAYSFELKVTDNSGATATDTVNVIVNAALLQVAPLANAGSDMSITLPDDSLTLSGSGSASNGTITSYQWTKVSGPSQFSIESENQAHTKVKDLATGVYKFELKVTDNMGAKKTDTVQVTVNAAAAPHHPPVANAGPDMTITLPTNSVILSGSGSESDGTIASYQWTKISGPAQYVVNHTDNPQTILADLVAGDYEFELDVKDDLGAIGKDTVRISVNEKINPTIKIFPNPAINEINLELPATKTNSTTI